VKVSIIGDEAVRLMTTMVLSSKPPVEKRKDLLIGKGSNSKNATAYF